MSKTGEVMTIEMPEESIEELEEIEFDESVFVRSAQAKSVRRMALIAASVVFGSLLLFAGVWIAWNISIQAHSNRISNYLSELVALSQPNTFIAGALHSDRRFPGARDIYLTYRPVGSNPVNKSLVTVDYDFWGGEVSSTGGGYVVWTNPTREFAGTEMAPSLRFLYPGKPSGNTSVRPQPEHQAEIEQVGALTRDAEVRLESAPASATAELAISFRDFKTLDEVKTLLADGVLLNWGAVDVWEFSDGPSVPADGSMVGISFVGPDGGIVPVATQQLEKNISSSLRTVARLAPKGTADKCIQSAEYIERNGVKYYGVVVTGPASDMRALLGSDDVSAASLGFVVEPWQ